MIAKCKAIAHGGNALEYVFREGKLGRILALHNLCGETPKEIHEEMKLIGDYNSRCKNKFLRIEIGIAPKDEPLMTFKTLNRLALLFAKQMGLDDHQWVAVTHKDTDNLHIHIIANRISLGGQVYDTTFVSNRAARVAEELSHKYGLKFTYDGHSFKASEIGREFGFRTLPKQFESNNAQNLIIPSSHSSMRSTTDSTPIAHVVSPVVDVALDTAGSLLSEVGEVTTLQTHGADCAEIAWQRRLRNEAGKKKKLLSRRHWTGNEVETSEALEVAGICTNKGRLSFEAAMLL